MVDELLLYLDIVFGIILTYLLLNFIFSIIMAKGPYRPFDDYPEWGNVKDFKIQTRNGKYIEAWYIEHNGSDNPTILMCHGWGRNRGRMVARARIWKDLGYNCLLISFRNHGNSDKELFGMSIIRFSQDIEDVLNYWNKPVVLLGHSIGAGASILVAGRGNPHIRALVAESPVRSIPKDLDVIYRPVLKGLIPFVMPGMKFVLKLFFYPYRKDGYDPIAIAPKISIPVLLTHGRNDQLFPPKFSEDLAKVIENAEVHILERADHSSVPEQPEYRDVCEGFHKIISN